MKHAYSIPNHSKEDTLYKARETLKAHHIVSPLYGTISVYKYMRKYHATNSLVLKLWIPKDESLRTVYMVQGWEVSEDVFKAAITLVTEWGYDVSVTFISWGSNYIWEKRGA